MDHRLLQYLRIHHKSGNIRILTQPRHDRVIDIAHAALQRDASASHLFQQKGDHVIGDLLAHGIDFIKRVAGVGQFGLHDRDNLLRIDLHVPAAHAIHGMKDGDAVAPRRRAGDHDISQLGDARIVVVIQLDDHFLRPQQPGWRVADTAGEPDPSVRRDSRSFDHRDINLAKEPIVDHLRHFAQVQVDKIHLPLVDFLPQAGGGLIRRAPRDGIGRRERIIGGSADGGAGQQADLEWLLRLM